MKCALRAFVFLLFVASSCQASSRLEFDWGLAVLNIGTSEDARQEQLAVRNALLILGIPFVVTNDVDAATRRAVVIVGGILFNTELTPPERESLYAYVEQGGILFATQVKGNMFFPLFGLHAATASRTNFRLHFSDTREPVLRYLDHPSERTVSLGDPELYSETIWTTEYSPGPQTSVLARYENGTVAFTRYGYGRGVAYALGPGFKETTFIPQIARSYEAARRWINSFEPSGDVFRLLLRGLYEDRVHPFLLVHTIPDGKKTAIVLSHDVDARESFRNSLDFAKMEDSLGVRSTFFVTTKYFSDDTDIDYYTAESVDWLKKVKNMGFEIASHSVSHSLEFDKFPVGSTEVNRSNYQPDQPTLFGEARVSKQLLDQDLQLNVNGFRAGYLRFPSELLRILEETGYRYDSSVSAQYVLTNYPYFGFRRRSLEATQSNIVVVPVTLDDSREFLTAETQEDVLRTWTEIVSANADNGAITCLLIHPTDITYKLETERRFIEENLNEMTWIGDVGSIAQFWHDRNGLHPVVNEGKDGDPVIVLNMKLADIPPGQSLVVERVPGVKMPKIMDADGMSVLVKARESEDRFVLLLP